MYAIKVTQEDVDLNNLQRNVNDILIYQELPKNWNGRNDFQNEKDPENYGFFQYIKPNFDKETQRLGAIHVNKRYINNVLELTEEELAERLKSKVPLTVKNMHFRIALINNGISIKSINDEIDLMPNSPQKEFIITMWNHAEHYERANTELNAMASQLGITDEQLDGLFLYTLNL
tara:strand:- start:1597 stop:2121 length:525 start_codon:yes stop_codon:yes gene_type:complete